MKSISSVRNAAGCLVLGTLLFCPLAMTEETHPIFVESPKVEPENEANYFKRFNDNSFLIEEAYNQEKGAVQHTFKAFYGHVNRFDQREREWELEFSQEWPLFSQDHQFAFAVPYFFTEEIEEDSREKQRGVGDVELEYRYQLFYEKQYIPAVAPTFALVLPTGNQDRGFGHNRLGYDFQLPFSKTLTSRVHVNLNAGLTYFPDVEVPLANFTHSSGFDLIDYNLGGNVIFAITPQAHVLLEALWEANQDLEEVTDPAGNGLLATHRNYTHEVVLSPGFRFVVDLPGEVQIVPGIGVPIGLSEDAMDWGAILYLSIEHPFLPKRLREAD